MRKPTVTENFMLDGVTGAEPMMVGTRRQHRSHAKATR
jgi:hypothetical protein